MFDLVQVVESFTRGEVWEGALALAGVDEELVREAAGAVSAEMEDTREILDLISELTLPPDPPLVFDGRMRMVSAEAMRLLCIRLALGLVETNWRDLTGPAADLCGCESSFRVQEAGVELLVGIANAAFDESRGFWRESLVGSDSHLAGAAIRALALSDVPVLKVLDLLEAVIDDTRRAVREAISVRALPELGRRDAQAVYARLGRWAARGDEIARWNVACALGTTLGGMYLERALEILELLATDERPMVWRAAAAALTQIAQRRPALVLPALARWRDDPKRFQCAQLALETLAHR